MNGYSGEVSYISSRVIMSPDATKVLSPLCNCMVFSDASEKAYSGVVYVRVSDTNAVIHTSVVTSKTRVAPIKRTLPRLELCGALVLAQLLSHCKRQGNPHRFKVYVGNRVLQIMDLIPPDRWDHVASTNNPADCASRGLYPSELLSGGMVLIG